MLEGPVGQPSAPVRVVQLAIEELRFRQRRALEANVAPGGPRRGGVTVDRSNELVGEGGPRERRLVGQLVVPPGEAGRRRDGNRSGDPNATVWNMAGQRKGTPRCKKKPQSRMTGKAIMLSILQTLIFVAIVVN